MKEGFHLIGSVPVLGTEYNIEQDDANLRLCLFFLTDLFSPPPEGSYLTIITATYDGNDFRTIALGFDGENQPSGTLEYADDLTSAMSVFMKAIDWKKIQRPAIRKVREWEEANYARLKAIREQR